jgi:hypothetical protein
MQCEVVVCSRSKTQQIATACAFAQKQEPRQGRSRGSWLLLGNGSRSVAVAGPRPLGLLESFQTSSERRADPSVAHCCITPEAVTFVSQPLRTTSRRLLGATLVIALPTKRQPAETRAHRCLSFQLSVTVPAGETPGMVTAGAARSPPDRVGDSSDPEVWTPLTGRASGRRPGAREGWVAPPVLVRPHDAGGRAVEFSTSRCGSCVPCRAGCARARPGCS